MTSSSNLTIAAALGGRNATGSAHMTTPPAYYPEVGTGDSADAVVETAPIDAGGTGASHSPTPG